MSSDVRTVSSRCDRVRHERPALLGVRASDHASPVEARAVMVMQQLTEDMLWDATEKVTRAGTDLMRALVVVKAKRALVAQDDARTALADAMSRMHNALRAWDDAAGHGADVVAERLGF